MPFLALFNSAIFWSKNNFFCYPQDQKMIFTDLFIQKKISKKKYDFWTKTMDYPLRKMSIF